MDALLWLTPNNPIYFRKKRLASQFPKAPVSKPQFLLSHRRPSKSLFPAQVWLPQVPSQTLRWPPLLWNSRIRNVMGIVIKSTRTGIHQSWVDRIFVISTTTSHSSGITIGRGWKEKMARIISKWLFTAAKFSSMRSLKIEHAIGKEVVT